jgi:hypothetical protein
MKYLKLLARRNIPARNSIEEEGNLMQILSLSTVRGMKSYLAKGDYLSHQINAELIKLMYGDVMTKIVDDVKKAVFFSIVIDETKDISGQLNEVKCSNP